MLFDRACLQGCAPTPRGPGLADEGLDRERAGAEDRADDSAARGPDHDIGVGGIPACRHLDGEEGAEVERGTGHAASAQNEADTAHGGNSIRPQPGGAAPHVALASAP